MQQSSIRIILQLVEEFPALRGTMKLTTVFTRACSPFPIMDHLMNPVHTLLSYSFQIHFNIILPLIPRSTKWSCPQVFTTKPSMLFFSLPHTTTGLDNTWHSRKYLRPSVFCIVSVTQVNKRNITGLQNIT